MRVYCCDRVVGFDVMFAVCVFVFVVVVFRVRCARRVSDL